MFDFPTKKIFRFSTQSKSNSRLTILKLKNILPHHHSEIEFLRLYCHPVTVIREIFINRKLGKHRIEEGRPPSFTTWIVALESSLSSSRSKWEWHITQNTKNINSEREAWNITKKLLIRKIIREKNFKNDENYFPSIKRGIIHSRDVTIMPSFGRKYAKWFEMCTIPSRNEILK